MSAIDFSKLITVEDRAKQEAEALAQVLCAEARAYLSETDWYVTRLIETGTEIPEEIRAQRDTARRALA